jgi:hypothetical protein
MDPSVPTTSAHPWAWLSTRFWAARLRVASLQGKGLYQLGHRINQSKFIFTKTDIKISVVDTHCTEEHYHEKVHEDLSSPSPSQAVFAYYPCLWPPPRKQLLPRIQYFAPPHIPWSYLNKHLHLCLVHSSVLHIMNMQVGQIYVFSSGICFLALCSIQSRAHCD